MSTITLNKVEPGMVVTEDVKGSSGQPLLCAGTELTAKHIRILKTWGVNTVVIEGEDEPEAAAVVFTEEALLEAAQYLEPRFALNDIEHPVISRLLKVAQRKIAIKIQLGVIQ